VKWLKTLRTYIDHGLGTKWSRTSLRNLVLNLLSSSKTRLISACWLSSLSISLCCSCYSRKLGISFSFSAIRDNTVLSTPKILAKTTTVTASSWTINSTFHNSSTRSSSYLTECELSASKAISGNLGSVMSLRDYKRGLRRRSCLRSWIVTSLSTVKSVRRSTVEMKFRPRLQSFVDSNLAWLLSTRFIVMFVLLRTYASWGKRTLVSGQAGSAMWCWASSFSKVSRDGKFKS